ncbi:polymer-forming cytoskeletal protein [Pseudomonas rubra]|uniref:Polymer-forming cytoskeletal protein n=1 Tax=Pseudomonas rubra TaxID=2942627 RepID=A0ABT5P9V2_9PSED|nr:polymer-forming cytoskeletal protein [Pseudomonas rubra]MDD1015089.1 polymer-forming cytoskeletal protein [Pseudomonas rubra]MDD1038576.1 polymer-forming cytoskeletal protein [Pseudomonas rubra]MDD1154732.1 polymer-forming cytoskeletal protein [Pseudomonas rubra]
MGATGRSLSDFVDLNDVEDALLAACRKGEVVRIHERCPDSSEAGECVRADLLRFLLLGGDAAAPVHERGVRLEGVCIEGQLDLSGTTLSHPLSLVDCLFEYAPNLTDAKVSGTLVLANCQSPGLLADRLVTRGALDLSSFRSSDRVDLEDAQIGGGLYLSGADLDGNGGDALLADRVEIRGALLMADGFRSRGCVSFEGARVSGQINCRGARFNGKGEIALILDQVAVNADVYLSAGFRAKGTVRCVSMKTQGALYCSDAKFDGKGSEALILDSAHINGSLYLSGAAHTKGTVRCLGARIDGQFKLAGARLDGRGESALGADGLQVKGDINFGEGFTAKGAVRLVCARVEGQLVCRGHLKVSEGAALSADGIVVRGGVFLVDECLIQGQVRFIAARITGQFNCRGAEFEGNAGIALTASSLVLTGNALLTGGFRAKGQVRFNGAQIEGDLIGKDAVLEGDARHSLMATGAVITGTVRLREGFDAWHSVNFARSRIAGDFNCAGACLTGERGRALVLDGAQIDGTLALRNIEKKLSSSSFVGARVGELDDDENSWGEEIALNGLVYKALSARAPVCPAFRAAWLGRQIPSLKGPDDVIDADNDFRPQPWRHLQKVLEEMGHSAQARDLGIAYEHKLREIGHVGQPPTNWWPWVRSVYSNTSRGLHFLYGKLTGFGYRPMQLLIWFAGIWLFCGAVYWYAASQKGVFAPSNPIVFQSDSYLECRPDRADAWRKLNPGKELPANYIGHGNWYLCDSLREEYTGFSPLAYSLDVLMPLVDLQQESDWAPLVPTPKQGYWDEFTSFGWKHFVRLVIWLEILIGWGISLLMVAIVSGLARRSE